MPRPLAPLPAALATRPFTVAQARGLGISRERLRHPDLLKPTRGVRVPTADCSVRAEARVIASATTSPFAFSHLSAAYLLDLPLPWPWHPSMPWHLMRPTNLPIPRRTGVVGHRGLESRARVEVAGLPVVGPLDTWADVAGLLPIDELVVVGDVLARRGTSPGDLLGYLDGRPGRRGIRALREAASLTRIGSASRMETLTRLMFARGGLPEPELNADVHDDAGFWLLRADFLWRRYRVIGEYHGDIHRSSRRVWQDGFARRRLAEASGWRVVELTSREVFHPQAREELLGLLRAWLV